MPGDVKTLRQREVAAQVFDMLLVLGAQVSMRDLPSGSPLCLQCLETCPLNENSHLGTVSRCSWVDLE